MKLCRAPALVLGLCLAGFASAEAANLIKNGSFEAPAVSLGSYRLICTLPCPGQPAFPGWTVVGAANANVAIVNRYSQGGLLFLAHDGKQYVDLTGNSNAPAGVEQVVTTQKGAEYTLSFYVGVVYDTSGVFAPLSKVDVFVDGALLTSAVNVARPGEKTQGWQRFSAKFTAASTRTTIFFLNGDPPDLIGGDNGLDNVSLVPTSAK
jgi:hypothetical protein